MDALWPRAAVFAGISRQPKQHGSCVSPQDRCAEDCVSLRRHKATCTAFRGIVEWERGIPSLSSAAPPLLQRSQELQKKHRSPVKSLFYRRRGHVNRPGCSLQEMPQMGGALGARLLSPVKRANKGPFETITAKALAPPHGRSQNKLAPRPNSRWRHVWHLRWHSCPLRCCQGYCCIGTSLPRLCY